MHELRILGHTGDVEITWDPDNDDSITKARKEFNTLIQVRGMAIYRVNEDNSTERVDTFDPTEGRYVALPQLVGG